MDDQAAPSISAAKRALRERILGGRVSLAAGVLQEAGCEITRRLLELPAMRTATIVAAYVGLDSEVPIWLLVEALTKRGTTVLLPVLEADDSLTWGAFAPGSTLVAGRKGIRQPASGASSELSAAQVVVVPGVCYDNRGNRLGRGGGSYDRALRKLPAGITTIGLALDSDVVGNVPVEPHDQQVQLIVTPTRVITSDDGSN